MKNQIQQFYDRFFIIIRGFIVGVLILILLIPQFFIHELIRERTRRQDEVIAEVTNKWAGPQTLHGPLLFVPAYKNGLNDHDGYTYVWIKPNLLKIGGEIDTQVKHRSIYKVVLYKTELDVSGSFKDLGINPAKYNTPGMLWNKAQLCVSLLDYEGVTDVIRLTSGNQESEFSSNPYDVAFIANGLAAPFPIKTDSIPAEKDFSFHISVKGSQQLSFLPYAQKTEIRITSGWDKPSFTGRTLPDSQVDSKGFTATWNILDVKKTIPDYFPDMYNDHVESEVGVKLLQGQDHYSKTERSIKYAILIITLTFVVYIFIELLQKRRISAAQYILVGAALCIFYTLLLSISEYVGFNIAYLVAAAAVISQISIYTGTVFKSFKTGFIFGLLMTVLYLFIFSLIQLEDYALIAGSVGLFMILSLVMFVSRKIKWNKTGKEEEENTSTGA